MAGRQAPHRGSMRRSVDQSTHEIGASDRPPAYRMNTTEGEAVIVSLLREISASTSATPAAVAAAVIAGIPAAVAAAVAAATQPPPPQLCEEDRAAVGLLFQAIEESFGVGVNFTGSELIELAAEDNTMRRALEQIYGSIDRGTARRLGKLLRRARGFVHTGVRVERLADTRAGALWTLKRV